MLGSLEVYDMNPVSGIVFTFVNFSDGAVLSVVSGAPNVNPVDLQKNGSYLQLESLQSVAPLPSLSNPSPHADPFSISTYPWLMKL